MERLRIAVYAPKASCQQSMVLCNDSAISTRGERDVLDNLWFCEFCEAKQIRMAFFLSPEVPSGPMARSPKTPVIYEGIVRENNGVAEQCECQGGAAVRDQRGTA